VRLNWLTLHWERLARRDPYFAVLTDVDKRVDSRDIEQFYRTGSEEIAAVLRRAGELGLTVPPRRALDFGCGVGRLTHALADRFDRADGVDISASMLRIARQRCRRPDRCHFHRNGTSDLALFGDGDFSFAYSTLVLQHMEPPLIAGYVRELVRVLAADGLLVFQVPSHRIAHAGSPAATRTPAAGPLSVAAFRARMSVAAEALSGHGGEQIMLPVTVENVSSETWPSLPDARGRFQINLGNHWRNELGELVQRDDQRAALPFDLTPGARAQVTIGVRAPRVNGRYVLELDLVQEHVGWFAEHGSAPLRVPCAVNGGLDGPPLPPIAPLAASSSAPRFSERHPQLFAALRACGVRDVYWAGRRMVDGIKGGRDELIRRRLHPVINWWERQSFAPRMEMHCLPRAEVEALVAAAGGRVLHVDDEMMSGGYQSCRYWVVRST
jgi:SAM-dependent methyltransferase